jgi:hypothetical protein
VEQEAWGVGGGREKKGLMEAEKQKREIEI